MLLSYASVFCWFLTHNLSACVCITFIVLCGLWEHSQLFSFFQEHSALPSCPSCVVLLVWNFYTRCAIVASFVIILRALLLASWTYHLFQNFLLGLHSVILLYTGFQVYILLNLPLFYYSAFLKSIILSVVWKLHILLSLFLVMATKFLWTYL